MKIILFISFLVIVICREGSLTLGSPVSTQVFDKMEALDSLSGNHYFQATKQIFYINAQIKNPNCTQNQEPILPPNVPSDYIITPGIGAHKFHSTPETWNDARNTCIKEGAHLIILRSADEVAILNKLQPGKDAWSTWVGVHEQFKNDDWMTVLDEPLDQVGFAPWKKGEPNHSEGIEHCVEYGTEPIRKGLNDIDCKKVFPFFCKIDL